MPYILEASIPEIRLLQTSRVEVHLIHNESFCITLNRIFFYDCLSVGTYPTPKDLPA